MTEIPTLLQLWSMAEAASFGIRISTDDPSLLRQQLYRARAEVDAHKDINIVIPDIPNQIWLVHATDERRTFDTIHSQPVIQGPGFPAKAVREPGSESGNSGDHQGLDQGDGE